MSVYTVVCGNCYQPIQFAVGDLVLRPRPASSDYPDGFLMVKCSQCDCFNPPSGMLGYELIKEEWSDCHHN